MPLEDGIETVVATATRRARAMQDVPQAINVFSEKNLKDVGAEDLASLAGSMAGVELRQEQAGQGGVAVRGISELNMMNLYGGTGSATGMYLDEMSLSAGGRFPPLGAFDVQRGAFTGVLNGTGMVDAMGTALVAVIPPALGPCTACRRRTSPAPRCSGCRCTCSAP